MIVLFFAITGHFLCRLCGILLMFISTNNAWAYVGG